MKLLTPALSSAVAGVAALLATSAPARADAAALTNHLASAASPYLREAASQPVAWYPWGPEPFRLAQALNRPILLDIGAITGHGGWPLTVFLTADDKVFYGGGTFLPDDRFGQPGFKTLLPKSAEVYHALVRSWRPTTRPA